LTGRAAALNDDHEICFARYGRNPFLDAASLNHELFTFSLLYDAALLLSLKTLILPTIILAEIHSELKVTTSRAAERTDGASTYP
jgi:hypothetical protein